MRHQMRIAILNHSSNISDIDVFEMVRVCQIQLSEHVAPTWSTYTARLHFYPGPNPLVPPSYLLCVLMDDPDVAGALGYHDETPDGKPYARVFTKFPDVSVTLSHEIIEMFLDPDCNRFAVDYQDGTLYAVEGGDPVEADTYLIDGVKVSNFITPAWFDRNHPIDAKFDWLGRLSEPFSMTPQGYLIYMRGSGEQQRYGFKFGKEMPQTKKEAKWFPASRTVRKLNQVKKVIVNA